MRQTENLWLNSLDIVFILSELILSLLAWIILIVSNCILLCSFVVLDFQILFILHLTILRWAAI